MPMGVKTHPLQTKSSDFLMDILEIQFLIWKSNLILEMDKTIVQNLELLSY